MFYITLVETDRTGNVLQVYNYEIDGRKADWMMIESSANLLLEKLRKPGEIWNWKWSPNEAKKMKVVYKGLALEEK